MATWQRGNVTGVRIMGADTSKDKSPGRQVRAQSTPLLPPPYQLAIEDIAFRMTVLDERGTHDHDSDAALIPPTWFSVELAAATAKRYLYLVQHETDTGLVVLILLFDRTALPFGSAARGHAPAGEYGGPCDDSCGLRLPPSGAWLRAVVDGTVFVLASDLVLTRKSITAWIGGHEPPTVPARPPYT